MSFTIACPATYEQGRLDPASDRTICVIIKAYRWPPGWNDYIVVTIIIRPGNGIPTSGVGQRERPLVEDAFIALSDNSLTVRRLPDLPKLLRLSPELWPKAELRVAPDDLRCDNLTPKSGERIRCQATVHNDGSQDAMARIDARIISKGSDQGSAQELPSRRIPSGGHVMVEWDWVLPRGGIWFLGVVVELQPLPYRPHPQERNKQNNRAFISVPVSK